MRGVHGTPEQAGSSSRASGDRAGWPDMALFGPTVDEVMGDAARERDDVVAERLSGLVRDALEVELDRALRRARAPALEECPERSEPAVPEHRWVVPELDRAARVAHGEVSDEPDAGEQVVGHPEAGTDGRDSGETDEDTDSGPDGLAHERIEQIERVLDSLDDIERSLRELAVAIDRLSNVQREWPVASAPGPVDPPPPQPALPATTPSRSVPSAATIAPLPPGSEIPPPAPDSSRGPPWGLVGRVVGVVMAVALTATALVMSWENAEETPAEETPAQEAASGEAASGEGEETGELIEEASAASPVTLVSPDETIESFLENPDVHLVAHADGSPLEVRDRPVDGDVQHRLSNPNENGSPLVVLVQERRGDWLKVDLPVRPNGSQGWIHRDEVQLTTHTYRIEVSVSERRYRLFRGDEVVMESAVAIGARDTPTPGGSFYIKELLQPPNPNTVYGPYAFGLSGFSNVLEDFAGGQGVIGIHGTDHPDAIGNEVSSGCIRLPNDRITELVGVLPLGTPVDIVA